VILAKPPLHVHVGRAVGSGHCVALVQRLGAPHTSRWRRGAKVRDGDVPELAVIATFDAAGRYANATDGQSHVAVFLEQTPKGLRVFDQWKGRPAGERVIQFRGGGTPADDGDAYYVVEEEAAV
jgi:hypothetical protein